MNFDTYEDFRKIVSLHEELYEYLLENDTYVEQTNHKLYGYFNLYHTERHKPEEGVLGDITKKILNENK